MALLSLVFTLLSVFTFWLVIPLFILPPLGAYCGYRFYRMQTQLHRPIGLFRKLLYMAPLLLAIAAFPLELYVLNTEYRA
jgi:hypothetical protein